MQGKNHQRILKAMLHSNRAVIASINKDMKLIVAINDEWKDSWVDDQKYSLYFGEVSDLKMVQRFFWDQAMAQYDCYANALIQQ